MCTDVNYLSGELGRYYKVFVAKRGGGWTQKGIENSSLKQFLSFHNIFKGKYSCLLWRFLKLDFPSRWGNKKSHISPCKVCFRPQSLTTSSLSSSDASPRPARLASLSQTLILTKSTPFLNSCFGRPGSQPPGPSLRQLLLSPTVLNPSLIPLLHPHIQFAPR